LCLVLLCDSGASRSSRRTGCSNTWVFFPRWAGFFIFLCTSSVRSYHAPREATASTSTRPSELYPPRATPRATWLPHPHRSLPRLRPPQRRSQQATQSPGLSVLGGGGGSGRKMCARARSVPRSATHGPSGRRIRAATFAQPPAFSRQPKPPRARWGRAAAATAPAPAVMAGAAASLLVSGPGSGGRRGTGGRGRRRQLEPARAMWGRAAAATELAPAVAAAASASPLVGGPGSRGRRGTGGCERPRQLPLPRARWGRAATATAPAPAGTAAAAASPLVGGPGSGGRRETGGRGRPRQLRPPRAR